MSVNRRTYAYILYINRKNSHKELDYPYNVQDVLNNKIKKKG